jgi:hypothetical protein
MISATKTGQACMGINIGVNVTSVVLMILVVVQMHKFINKIN